MTPEEVELLLAERRRLEVALRACEARLSVAGGLAKLGVWDWEVKTDLTTWNDQMLEIYGVSREEFTGRGSDYIDFTHPEFRAAQAANIERGFANGVTEERLRRGDFEIPEVQSLRIVMPDGTVRTTNGSAVCVVDDAGKPIRMLGVTHDVTERDQADVALRASLERFRLLIESAPAALGVSRGGLGLLANSRWRKLFGIPPERDISGIPITTYVAPEARAPLVERIARRNAGEETVELLDHETVGLRADGSRFPIEVSVSTVELPDGLAQLSIITDISVRRRAEEDRARLEEQIAQTRRIESLGRLAGGVAHDFNNLLTVILSYVESVESSLARGEPLRADDLQEIRVAGERARDLTRQLLAFARKQVIANRAMDVNAVVTEAVKLLRRVLGEDIALEVRTEEALWPINGDPGQLHQVLMNLALNARDAMPKGGKILIETANGCSAVDMDVTRWVRLLVRDWGEGLSTETKAHLFEPFFTTKEMGRGTGLGLATVHGIVEQSGGHVHVESELGQGTTFEICLPRSSDDVEAPSDTVASAGGGSEVVLVVEDDAAVRAVTVRALRSVGYEVLVAADGREALAIEPAALARVQLVVTDVVMPELSGPEVAAELLRRNPALRVLFVSGHPEDARGGRASLGSDAEFLPKPFTPKSLVARVRGVLDA